MKMMVSLITVLLMLSTSYCYLKANVEDTLTRSFDVSEGGKLVLDTDIGSIEVESSRKDRIKVNVFRKVRGASERKARELLDDFDIEFKQDGKNLYIDADYKRGRRGFLWFGRNRLRVKFVITVPRNYNLDLSTSGGSISVSDLNGEVISRTSGGSLSFGYIKGEIFGKTSGGSIRIAGCSGDVDVHTSGGSIKVGEVTGNIDASTSGGSIRVKEVKGTIQARTSGGTIVAYLSAQPKGDCSLKTSGGSINVYLVRDVNLDLDAKTSGGRVRSDFPVEVSGVIRRTKLNGKINGGGPELYIRTSGGSINIKEY